MFSFCQLSDSVGVLASSREPVKIPVYTPWAHNRTHAMCSGVGSWRKFWCLDHLFCFGHGEPPQGDAQVLLTCYGVDVAFDTHVKFKLLLKLLLRGRQTLGRWWGQLSRLGFSFQNLLAVLVQLYPGDNHLARVDDHGDSLPLAFSRCTCSV